jgi:resolvase-like protein
MMMWSTSAAVPLRWTPFERLVKRPFANREFSLRIRARHVMSRWTNGSCSFAVLLDVRLHKIAHWSPDSPTRRGSLLQSLGISLRSATEPIDDTSTGKLMEGVLTAFAQFDNDVRSDRTRGAELPRRAARLT